MIVSTEAEKVLDKVKHPFMLKILKKQSPETLRLQEGESSSNNCSYRDISFKGLHGYRQDLWKGPRFLFSLYSTGEEKQKDRLRATLLKMESSVYLISPKPEDSATYLCTVGAQFSSGYCILHQKPASGALE
uniref:Immunoglobulin V-set domain-containing protein n=1 Tax=Spermophilus dauricus TaxID=99837 RepID=A0A8C9QD14_SPEDA